MTFYGGLSAEHLTQFIERIERLESEKTNVAEDIKSVFQEAKSGGFDVKTMREIIKLRKLQKAELEEQEFLVDTYKIAVGLAPEPDKGE